MEPLSPVSELTEDDFYESYEGWSTNHVHERSSTCSSSLAVVAEVALAAAVAPPVDNATSCPGPKTTTSLDAKEFYDITTYTPDDFDDSLIHPALLASPASPCARLLPRVRHDTRSPVIIEHKLDQHYSDELQPFKTPGVLSTWSAAVVSGADEHSAGSSDGDRRARGAAHDNHSEKLIVSTPRSAESQQQRIRMEQDDLFMQEAEMTSKEQRSTRIENLLSRTAGDARGVRPLQEFRSYTAMAEGRPRTSGGGAARPVSRLGQLQSHHLIEDGNLVDIARQRRGSRHGSVSGIPISPRSPLNALSRSPERKSYGHLRSQPGSISRRAPQLFASAVEPHEVQTPPHIGLHRKQSTVESMSADSQTAESAVWDELDDLKSRIKKLELTGKPLTATVSSDTSPKMERPRTATTAPTTIDSSPKRDKKMEEHGPQIDVHQPSLATIHPLLHAALNKAKPLLNPTLYRSLEGTVNDALQMALMTGSHGQVGSPASVVMDRSLKRKADSMCRNLTDLCLALCEGKHEENVTSPGAYTGRISRAALVREVPIPSSDRPMSRLEARRSSILGDSPGTPSLSPRRDRDTMSVIDTACQPHAHRHQRSSSRFSQARSRFDDVADDDPTIRPASRNGSEFSFRSRQPQRSVSLREALAMRQGGGAGHRELGRVASMSSDAGRRWVRETTPPVLEEEALDAPSVQVKQRVSSISQLRQARGLASTPLRSSSVNRHSQQYAIE